MTQNDKFKCEGLELLKPTIMSYRQLLYQIVFGTKSHIPSINNNCNELYKYITGIIKNKNCIIYRINGTEDHIHIVCDIHPTIPISGFVQDIKVASSIWAKEIGLFPNFIGWAQEYGVFSYSIKERDILIDYVKNQKEHHKNISFIDEYRALLIEYGIVFD